MFCLPGVVKILNRSIWLSANDTYRFSVGYYGTGYWPCSTLSGERVFVSFGNNGDLIDYAGPEDVSGAELMACLSANLSKRAQKERARFTDCIR